MAPKTYPWKRSWNELGTRTLFGSDGFPLDAEATHGFPANRAALEFGQLESMPCLILLGDPGTGKSYAVNDATLKAQLRTKGTTRQVFYLNLRSYGSEDRLCRDLFESKQMEDWKTGTSSLELFLDSLDECRVRMGTVVNILKERLASLPRDRLSLRIACRTAEWPETLGEAFKEIWGEDNVGTYVLAPLSQADVATAATMHDLDASSFLSEIQRRAVQPFAQRPITLELLINLYARDSKLPSRATELYERGLRALCAETEERLDAELKPRLSGEQRFAVAARIAAGLILSNKEAVYVGPDRGSTSGDDVVLKELAGADEAVSGHRFPVDEEALRDAMRTALFTSIGPERRGFSHQTFGEFLAAHYLVSRAFTRRQIHSLVCAPDEPALRITPQLQETAGWLATLDSAIFNEILENEPEVLLRGDVATADAEARQKLVDRLLARVGTGEIPDLFGMPRARLNKLDHPGLEEQLRPLINAQSENVDVRNAAIDVAEACHLKTLADDLASRALDESEVADASASTRPSRYDNYLLTGRQTD